MDPLGCAASPVGPHGEDVLLALRRRTAAVHREVETTLGLTAPDLSLPRVARVVERLHAFWADAEAGLDRWAAAQPATARALDWERRRRAALFAADLRTLGAAPPEPSTARRLALPPVRHTGTALGRLYVLEGSTLGGRVVERALAPLLATAPDGCALRSFSPYGAETARMWRAFRRHLQRWVDAGGNPERVLAGAEETFAALASWCAPLRQEPVP